MARIEPLQAIRYPKNEQTLLVSPPYDVLSAADKANLLAACPENITALDLPHVPPKNAGPAEAYEAAGRTFRQWLENGTLKQDTQPAIYAYEQTYHHAGVEYHRRGLFCRVRLEEFGPQSVIHPHEQTFSGPKEDRLLLMRATHANLSPVFGLYDDPANAITSRLFSAIGAAKPAATAQLPTQDGAGKVRSDLWALTDPLVIKQIAEMLRSKHVYIADGHHRYTTCLTYRRELAGKTPGGLPENHPADFAMFVLVAMQDPGLIVLPTHRVVSGLKDFSINNFIKGGNSVIRQLPGRWTGAQLPDLETKLPAMGRHAMGIYDPSTDQAVAIAPVAADPLAALSQNAAVAGKSADWRQLDVAILQHLVFDAIVRPVFAGGNDLHWGFPHEAHEVHMHCRSGEFQAGFLLQPTPLEAVRQLCNANELMPQKSTFFYPKLATGMVINPLF